MHMYAWVTSLYWALFGSHRVHLPFSRCCGSRPCGRVGGADLVMPHWYSTAHLRVRFLHIVFLLFSKRCSDFQIYSHTKKAWPYYCLLGCLQTFANKESTPLHCSKIRDHSVSLLLSDLLLKFFDWRLIVFYHILHGKTDAQNGN